MEDCGTAVTAYFIGIVTLFALVVGGLSFQSWLHAKREIELRKLANAKDAEREKTIRDSYAILGNLVKK